MCIIPDKATERTRHTVVTCAGMLATAAHDHCDL